MVMKQSPQTFEELAEARKNLERELIEKGLTGVPSIDRPWRKYYTEEQLSMVPPQMTMTDYLLQQNANNMSLTALNYMGKKISYEEMFDHIEDTAKRFQKFGVKERDYVNLALPVSPETVYMIYGLDSIGAAACLIDPRVNAERMEYYLNLVKSNLVGVTGVYANTMLSAIKNAKDVMMLNISPLQSFDKGEKTQLKALYSLKMLSEHLKELQYNLMNRSGNKIISSKDFYRDDMSGYQLIRPQYVDDKVSLVEYTSGTTGIPKGLELSASAVNLAAKQLKGVTGLQPGQTILGIMPPFISYGAVCGTHAALSFGLEEIMIAKFSPEIFAELVLTHKPNVIVCVPMFLQLLMESPLVKPDTDLSFIQKIIVGGNKTDPEFEVRFNEWLNRHNCEAYIIKGGGMAEFSACAFYTPNKEMSIPGTYGVPLPVVDAKVVDDEEHELGYYEVGEIHISSKQGMKGYVNNPEETDKFFYTDENGVKYGRSGDLGYVDTDGMFTLLNRKKQMVIRPDGHNVFPAEISNVIITHPAVKDCIVVGISDEKYEDGMWPTAFIELKDEYLSDADRVLYDIYKLCVLKLPERDRPRMSDYYLVKNIVHTVEGKTDEKSTIKEENVLKKIKR